MRPTPATLPDELLAPVCSELGMRSPSELNPAERATAQLIARARMHPNPCARRELPKLRPRIASQRPLGFDGSFSVKCAAANDVDEE